MKSDSRRFKPIELATSNKPAMPTVEFIANLPTELAAASGAPVRRLFNMNSISVRFEYALLNPAFTGEGRRGPR
ncbi:MAG: hypothetical protein WCF85_19210 [Rhodospirillaceae bacterium]